MVVVSFIIAIATVFLLHVYSRKTIGEKSRFLRIFPSHVVASQREINIGYNSYYFSGTSSNNIYLGNLTAPIILKINIEQGDTEIIRLKLPPIITASRGNFRITVDSPYVFLNDRVTTRTYVGLIGDSCKYLGRLDSFQSLEIIPISTSTFVLRTYSKRYQQSMLLKAIVDNSKVKRKTYLLKKHLEGFFSTDGILEYDRQNNRLAFIYYYRNRFAILDTNLNLLYERRTLDKTEVPDLQVSTIYSEEISTFSAPPLVVNKKASIFGDYLLINSNLPADNENMKVFDDYSVIDVYMIREDKYKMSFYIPKLNSEKLSDFRFSSGMLFALYDRYLAIYKIGVIQ